MTERPGTDLFGLRLGVDVEASVVGTQQCLERIDVVDVGRDGYDGHHAPPEPLRRRVGSSDGPPPARVPEVIVLIDWNTLRDGVRAAGGVCELSDGTPLPVSVVRQMACDAQIIPVVLGGHGQVLDVGRSRRLATAAQRTALRAMYSTCAEPGCDMPIDDCRAHHIIEWDPTRRNGNTDLNNLVPVCEQTHTRIHQHGWHVKIIGNHERMIWTRPDGTITYDGPAPNRKPRSNPTGDDDPDDPDDHR